MFTVPKIVQEHEHFKWKPLELKGNGRGMISERKERVLLDK